MNSNNSLTLTGLASMRILPHDTASSGRAPLSLPSNSCAAWGQHERESQNLVSNLLNTSGVTKRKALNWYDRQHQREWTGCDTHYRQRHRRGRGYTGMRAAAGGAVTGRSRFAAR